MGFRGPSQDSGYLLRAQGVSGCRLRAQGVNPFRSWGKVGPWGWDEVTSDWAVESEVLSEPGPQKDLEKWDCGGQVSQGVLSELGVRGGTSP